jgi:hypothetical protein
MKRLSLFRSKHGLSIAALAAVAALALLVRFVLLVPTPAAPMIHPARLTISAPDSAPVGSVITIIVAAEEAEEGTPATLVAQDSYGLRVYRAPLEDGQAGFVLTSEETRHAGLLRLVATVGNTQRNTSLHLLSGAPVGPLVPLVGPRSIAADGRDRSMVTVLPLDQFGNPAATGTDVQVRARHPDGSLHEQTVQVAHLLAWARIRSSTRAGRATIVATSEGASGPEAVLDEVAGMPQPFALAAEPPTLPADGRQLLRLRTTTLRDRFDNVLPDGTLVMFVVTAPDGTQRSIPAVTIDGSAEAPLQAPTTPGRATVQAVAAGVESAPRQIEFAPGPAVGRITLAAEVDRPAGALRLTAGPLTGALGQHIPAGTLVQFRLRGVGEALDVSAPAEEGYARVQVRLAELATGSYTVSATVGNLQGSTRVEVP